MSIFSTNIILVSNCFSFINCPKLDEIHHPPIEDGRTLLQQNRKPDDSLSDLKQKEIGYVLNPKYWGNEFIPEAVNYLIRYGFNLVWTF